MGIVGVSVWPFIMAPREITNESACGHRGSRLVRGNIRVAVEYEHQSEKFEKVRVKSSLKD